MDVCACVRERERMRENMTKHWKQLRKICVRAHVCMCVCVCLCVHGCVCVCVGVGAREGE